MAMYYDPKAAPVPGTNEWYQASEDARTLVRAEEIKADTKRSGAATFVLDSQRAAVIAATKVATKASKR